MSAAPCPPDACCHDRAPLKRIGIYVHRGRRRYLLLCTECGFVVSTDEVRRLRRRVGAMR